MTIAGLVAAVALLAAAPAHAAKPSGQITNPAADAELDAASQVALSVSFQAPQNGEITNVRLTLESIRSGRLQQKDFTVGEPTFSHTWSSFDAGLLDYNGEYRIRAQATATDGVFDPNGAETTELARSFFLAVPPVPPADVDATFNENKRTVVVTWTGNPEPDLLGYLIQRSKDGGAYGHLAEVEPGATNFTDDVGGDAGDYSYRVVALREGAQGINDNPAQEYEALNSDPSGASSVTVSAPPTSTTETPTSTATAGDGSGGAAETTTSTSEQPAFDNQGRVNLSNFASLLDQARARPAPRPTLPDPGFTDELPYGTRPPTTAAPTTAGRPDVEIALADNDEELGDEERLRSMAFLAGGLFAFVLLMHLVWIRTEVKHAPLPVEEPANGDPVDEDPGESDGSSDEPPAGTLEATPPTRRRATPASTPPKRSQGARGAAHRVPSRSRGDRREGRPAVRAGR